MRLPRVSSTLQEVGSYLALFSIFGLEMVGCSSSYWVSFAEANWAPPRQGHEASPGRKWSLPK